MYRTAYLVFNLPSCDGRVGAVSQRNDILVPVTAVVRRSVKIVVTRLCLIPVPLNDMPLLSVSNMFPKYNAEYCLGITAAHFNKLSMTKGYKEFNNGKKYIHFCNTLFVLQKPSV